MVWQSVREDVGANDFTILQLESLADSKWNFGTGDSKLCCQLHKKKEQRQKGEGLSFTDHLLGRHILAETAARARKPPGP